jgi:hypothetical protein
VLISQLTSWDSEKDAREFFDAYVKRTERRYSGAETIETIDGVASARRVWRTGTEGTVLMERNGSRVLILEGVPAKADTKALLKSIWPKA